MRERNLHGIYGSGVPLSLLSPALPAYPLIDPVEILNDPDYNRDTTDPFYGFGSEDTSEDNTDAQDDPYQTDRSVSSRLPGGMNMQRWEEWVYINVSAGLVITFVDVLGNGDYRYATPPPTSDLTMATVLQQYAPVDAGLCRPRGGPGAVHLRP